MNHQSAIAAALAGIFALGVAATAVSQPVPQPTGTEKRYGIAKGGQNDCGTASTPAPARARRGTTNAGEIRYDLQGHLRKGRRRQRPPRKMQSRATVGVDRPGGAPSGRSL